MTYSCVSFEIYVTGDEAGDENVVESSCTAKYNFQKRELSSGSYQMHYYKCDLQQVVEHEVVQLGRLSMQVKLVACSTRVMLSYHPSQMFKLGSADCLGVDENQIGSSCDVVHIRRGLLSLRESYIPRPTGYIAAEFTAPNGLLVPHVTTDVLSNSLN
jgi:hypothetical protein